MNEANHDLTNLHGLAQRLRLPARWLKAEANAGRIPVLRVGRQLRFNVQAVAAVLAERAGAASSTERREAGCGS